MFLEAFKKALMNRALFSRLFSSPKKFKRARLKCEKKL